MLREFGTDYLVQRGILADYGIQHGYPKKVSEMRGRTQWDQALRLPSWFG
jgi:hypothetical protein